MARIGLMIGFYEFQKGCQFDAEQDNAPRRHYIPKIEFQVKNWDKRDAGLLLRGTTATSVLVQEQ